MRSFDPDDLATWPDDRLWQYFFGVAATSISSLPLSHPSRGSVVHPPAKEWSISTRLHGTIQKPISCNAATAGVPQPPPPSLCDRQPMHSEREWRSNASLRRTHWLCVPCGFVVPRTTLACSNCNAADHASSQLDGQALAELINQFCSHSSMTSLDLSHNAFGPDGAIQVSSALASAPALLHLNLSATGAGDAGAVAIARVLQSSAYCTLRKIQLIGCSVKDEGGRAFAALLLAGRQLETLDLGWNSIRGEAAVLLGHAAAESAPTLAQFNGLPISLLKNGRLPPVPPLTDRDRRRRPIIDPEVELHLQGTGCGAPGAHAISKLLPVLPQLAAIVMPYQDLRDEGGVVLATAAAKYCPQLTFMMLSRNDISAAATGKIRALIPRLDDFHLRVNNRGG